jgi:hypothetical protein
VDDLDIEELFKQKMLSIFRLLGTNEYCRVYKKCGEQFTIEIKSVDETTVIAKDKKGEIVILMISDIEKIENIDQVKGKQLAMHTATHEI